VRASEARYRTLFECVPDGILIADLNDRCLDANPKMCSMLGYASEEMIGLNASAMILGQGIQCVESVSGPIRGESGDIRQLQFRRKDGATFPAEVVTTAIPDDNLMIMVRDISQRKQLEAHLLQAQKMESIGRLAGGIAHDFNNLLVPIIGYADLWMMKLPADSPIYADLQKMREAADRAAGLTRQILAFSRKQLLEMQIIDLNVIITEFKRMIHRLIGEDIELETFLDHALYPVKADKVQIEQVLLNLVINAREAMPSGGKMIIETANTYLDETYVKRHAGDHLPGQYIMLAVSDTGQGMDSDTQRRAFEPFFTTKEPGKGTGLGLATVFGIVKQHRGSIWVYSEPGKGATCKIYLPQAEGVVQMPVAEEAYSPHYGTETVLVVEDEDMVRKLVCETLAAHGYDILEAQTPNTVLQLISTREKIDLLLTDVVMPEMNGRELYEKVTEIQPGARVLFMSGYTDNVIVHHEYWMQVSTFSKNLLPFKVLSERSGWL
jgi:two-component system, cell cycle sensor histidine kinase and response regulator CckA